MSGKISSEKRSHDSLGERRRRSRRRVLLVSGISLCIILGGLIYGVWRPAVRISTIVMYGTDQSLAEIVRTGLSGSYFGIIPHDSTFFLYESGIRSAFLSQYPDIAAISIFRNGLTGLSIRVDTRAPVARWCGSTFDPTSAAEGKSDFNSESSKSDFFSAAKNLVGSDATCYIFDSSGFIFAPVATSTVLVNDIALYEPLGSGAASTSPVGETLPLSDKLSAAFDFARQLGTFGSPVRNIVFHDGEVDQYLYSGTRITYVFGNEQNAFTALMSARANLNLSDGSILYVDLRFDGKVYLKRKE